MVCPPSSSPGDCAFSSLQLALHPLAKNWWAVTDSNRRHSACKAGWGRRRYPTKAHKKDPRSADSSLFLVNFGPRSRSLPDTRRRAITATRSLPRGRHWHG
jgi:hypothetical protein